MILIPFGQKFQAVLILTCIALPGFANAVDNSSKPEAAVPSVTYRSVFRETSLGVERDQTNWRKANDDVGKFTRGHVDILKQEDMDSKAMDKKPMPAPAPARASSPAPSPVAAPAKAPVNAPAAHKH